MATIRCPLSEASGISAQQIALLDRARSMHYLELEKQVRRLAMLLVNAGVKPGMRVGLRMANSIEMIQLLLAVPRTGAIVAPLSLRLPAPALLAQLRQIDAALLLTSRADDPGLHPADMRVIAVEQLESFVDGFADPVENPQYDLQAPHTIVFTSGSSGEPKPAVLSLGALYYSARGVNFGIPLRSNDRWLLSLPLHHVGGLGVLYRCLLSGATVALPKPGEDLGEEILLYNATHVSVVPTQLARLMGHVDLEAINEGLKVILLGGAPCPPGLLHDAAVLRLPVCCSYGLTEMASTVTAVTATTPRVGRMTSGEVLRHRELTIQDGEICVRGPSLFSGYWRDGAVHLPMDEQGWFHTGDLGALSPEGFLTVAGRKDNMFISGGENIHPEEIERALCLHAGAAEALVVPVPDAEFGQRPVAFVRMKDPKAGLDGLREALAPHLARFQIPDRFLPLPLEEGEGMKINRATFARLAAQAASAAPAKPKRAKRPG